MNKPSAIADVARGLVAQKTQHRMPRREAKLQGLITSLGSERTYSDQVSQYLKWRLALGLPQGGPYFVYESQEYLDQLSEVRGQKSIDQALQALRITFSQQLEHVASVVAIRRKDKYLQLEQVQKICEAVPKNHVLSILICLDAGIRASELLTIRRTNEMQATPARPWHEKLFIGRASIQRYVVHGKGGLRREIALSTAIAAQLEQRRLQTPLVRRDREIIRECMYDLAAGQNFSNYFSRAAFTALKQNHGAHCLRHTFTQNRFRVLQQHVKTAEAMLILSQELGHFRPQITHAYF